MTMFVFGEVLANLLSLLWYIYSHLFCCNTYCYGNILTKIIHAEDTGGGGGGGNLRQCHDFRYGRAAGVPRPHLIHILGKVKNRPIHILPISKIVYPFIYYFSNFTFSYTFWVKKIPHWYTFDVKMIPMIHILGGLKSIPLPAARLYIPL